MKRFIFLIFVGFLSLSITVLISWLFYAVETSAITAEFEDEVDGYVLLLQQEIQQDFQTLYRWRDIYETFGVLNDKQFKQLSQGILNRYKSIKDVAWAPLVKQSNKIDFEESMRQKLPNFAIRSFPDAVNFSHGIPNLTALKKEKEYYFPITFVEPSVGAQAQSVIGLDIGMNQERLQRLEKVRDNGKISATEVFPSFTDASHFIFGAYVPIYQGPANTLEERRSHHAGFLVASFSVPELIQYSKINQSADIDFILSDDNPNGGIATLYESLLNKSVLLPQYRYDVAIGTLPGRSWTLTAIPTVDNIDAKRGITPWVSFFTGSIASILIMFYFHLLWKRTDVISQEVEERTQDLNQANTRLELLSRTDALTGLANRRSLNEFLEKEWKRGQREQLPITALLMDVDFFKPYNDTYGHLQGDQCLHTLAQAIQDSVQRPTDLVARYGGEEFAVILPNTGEESLAIAEKIRSSVEALKLNHKKSTVSPFVTISIGMATLVPTEETSPRELVNRADEALYKAKTTGRNKVAIYT